jgi:phage repressor protein C with HTH and peptisase S24 domain
MADAYCKLLQSLLKNSGRSQRAIARAAGITSGYLSRIASGQEAPATPETNTAIARACGASQQDIAELTFLAASQRHPDVLAVVDQARQHGLYPRQNVGPIPEQLATVVAVPIINWAPAGPPEDWTDLDYPVGHADEYFPVLDCNDSNAFGIKVLGSSMVPAYHSGDILIFFPSVTAESGQDCFVRFSNDCPKGHGVTFKRVEQVEDQLLLIPLNKAEHENILVNRLDVDFLCPLALRIEKRF